MEKIASNTGRQVTFSASAGIAVTANDTTVLSPGCLYVGTGGDVAVKLADSATVVVFKNVPNGTFLPVVVTKVMATDTVDAGDFILLY